MTKNDTQAVDERWMALAIQLAWQGQYTTTPNPRVGCVIVDASQNIIGTGAHIRAGEHHAEIHALKDAGKKAKGATAYVTLEPCSHTGKTPPCCEALIEACVSRVVVANTDPNPAVNGEGLKKLQGAGIETISGVLEEQAKQLNVGFFCRMRTGRPYVRVKLAASLDGRTALANGTSQWITGELARQDVQRFRATSCAVLTGVGTVEKDDPSLLVRESQAKFDDYPPGALRQPRRIVADTNLRLSPLYGVFNDGFKTTIATSTSHENVEFPSQVNFWRLPQQQNRISLPAILDKAGSEEVNDLWVECGSTLAGAFIQQQLFNEIIVYIAPKMIGQTGLPLLQLPEYSTLQACPQLRLFDAKPIGDDIRLTYVKVESG